MSKLVPGIPYTTATTTYNNSKNSYDSLLGDKGV